MADAGLATPPANTCTAFSRIGTSPCVSSRPTDATGGPASRSMLQRGAPANREPAVQEAVLDRLARVDQFLAGRSGWR